MDYDSAMGEDLPDVRETFARMEAEQFALTALTAPDGMEQWKRRMHSRCDPERGIYCPWCNTRDA